MLPLLQGATCSQNGFQMGQHLGGGDYLIHIPPAGLPFDPTGRLQTGDFDPLKVEVANSGEGEADIDTGARDYPDDGFAAREVRWFRFGEALNDVQDGVQLY